ncbi:MAG: ABC transporter ATP-binding protein/permease [Clostridiales bacterium]|nr:ABC transporter ATP-binding protein/permease [Clostridiales bacterium]
MIKTLLKSVRQYKRESLLAPLFVAFEVAIECMLPLMMAKLIDQMAGETMEPIVKIGVVLVIMALLSLMCGIISGRMAAIASCGFARNLRRDLFFRIEDFAFADIDHFSTSSLVTRMTTDVTNVQNAYQMIIRVAIRTPLMIIFSMTMCLTINARMALIFLALLPILGIVLFGISMYVHPIFRRIFRKYDDLNNSVQENVAAIRVVKSFVREDYEKEKFGHAAQEVCHDFTSVEKILAINNPFMMLCIYSAFMLVSFFGANMIINTAGSSLTTGQLSSLINYGVQILSSMMMLSMIFVMTSMATESASRIVEVLTWDSSLASPENGLTEVPDGSICFDHVSFRYHKESKKAALADVNLDIASGQTVGVMGGTGASKTTLIQLISRLYDVSEGSVRVGGHDVREYDLNTLRDSVAVVLQKNVLFSGTIKENLRWGNKNATDEELIRACKAAQADEFIEQMPDGYDTYIERGGSNVSGGQKQRLCIARALLKCPKVLILDDSTSAVDTKTDALIRRAFLTAIPETTKIIIAQRVSSVQDADVILVLDDGRIVEQGTHEELLAKHGIYWEAYETQTKSREAV